MTCLVGHSTSTQRCIAAESSRHKYVYVNICIYEYIIITDDNKNELLLACARIGLVPLLRALLQAGANAAHANKVRVRTPNSKKLAKCL